MPRLEWSCGPLRTGFVHPHGRALQSFTGRSGGPRHETGGAMRGLTSSCARSASATTVGTRACRSLAGADGWLAAPHCQTWSVLRRATTLIAAGSQCRCRFVQIPFKEVPAHRPRCFRRDRHQHQVRPQPARRRRYEQRAPVEQDRRRLAAPSRRRAVRPVAVLHQARAQHEGARRHARTVVSPLRPRPAGISGSSTPCGTPSRPSPSATCCKPSSAPATPTSARPCGGLPRPPAARRGTRPTSSINCSTIRSSRFAIRRVRATGCRHPAGASLAKAASKEAVGGSNCKSSTYCRACGAPTSRSIPASSHSIDTGPA